MTMIRAYGLFWNRDDVVWSPGAGRRLQLLGRRGERASSQRIVDFKMQAGIYILHNDYGHYYVGLVDRGGLARRLKNHVVDDHHANKWTRFSWFGVCAPTTRLADRDRYDCDGVEVPKSARRVTMTPSIRETEALLIAVLGTSGNLNKTRFPKAEQWTQIAAHDPRFEAYMATPPGEGLA